MLELMFNNIPIKNSLTGPGPTDLIGSYQDSNDPARYTGYYGETLGSQLILPSVLSAACGMGPNGVFIPDVDTVPWMKFIIDGRILFVSKKPIRKDVSRSMLDSANVVNGSKQITIDGLIYKVSLLTILKVSPSASTNADDAPITHGSEWNRLMYNVCINVNPASQEGDKWANYTFGDLGHNLYGTLSGQLITAGSTTYYALHLNGSSSTYQRVGGDFYTGTTNFGWRPVLELIGPA